MSFDHISPRASTYWADLATRYWKQTKSLKYRLMTLHSELDRVEGYNERLEERCADLEARLADLTNAQDVTESNRGYARWTD